MGKYNGKEIALEHMPFYGYKIRIVRELHMELDRLSKYSISILSDLNTDMSNIENYDYNFVYNENGDDFNMYPSLKNLGDTEKHLHYREGIARIDLGSFAITVFIDIFEINKSRGNFIDVLDIIHY